jgi:hypothetical protein
MRTRQAIDKSLAILSIAFLTAAGRADLVPTANPPVTVSRSRQFYVTAPDPRWSSVLCVFAEQLKQQWQQRLDISIDKWLDPVAIRLAERPTTNAAPIWMEVFRTDLHLRYQIEVRIPPSLDRQRVASFLLQALCAEYANRERLFPRQPPYEISQPPVWLVEGLAQSMVGSPEQLLPAIQRAAGSALPPTAEQLITAMELPSHPGERLRFQAAAWLLTESLLALPGGSAKLLRLLRTTNPGDNPQKQFHEIYAGNFADASAREKWWSLQMLTRAAGTLAQDLTATETSRQLTNILPTKLELRSGTETGQAVVPVGELFQHVETGWFLAATQEKLSQLRMLSRTAHPAYREVLGHYLAGLQLLAEHKVARGRSEITLAVKLQAAADRKSQQVRDYVDQAERIHTPYDDSNLREKIRLLLAADELELLRRDPISDYLNKFDK